MNDQEMRQKALELAAATQTTADLTPGDIVARARAYFDYMKGTQANG
jgi:hypothetical protein